MKNNKQKKESANESNNTKGTKHNYLHVLLAEGLLLICVAWSLFLVLSFLTYHRTDPGWSYLDSTQHVLNSGGRVGAWLADVFYSVCGYMAFLFPITLTYLSWAFFKSKRQSHDEQNSQRNLGRNPGRDLARDIERMAQQNPRTAFYVSFRIMGFLLVLIMGSALVDLYLPTSRYVPFQSGGVLGDALATSLLNTFNQTGTTVILLTTFLIGITLLTGVSWFVMIEKLGGAFLQLGRVFSNTIRSLITLGSLRVAKTEDKDKKGNADAKPEITIPSKKSLVKPKQKDEISASPIEPKAKDDEEDEYKPKKIIAPKPKETITKLEKSILPSTLPDLSLLNPPPQDKGIEFNEQELEAKSLELENRLADFNVQTKVVAVHPGPVVTRYELELAAGTKASKISNLSKDLARSLSVISVRVVEVIPGKSVIGVELPNKQREIVSLQEVLASNAYQNSRATLALALGKDIAGHPVVVDLAKMPHLLVAGTTGSGKSVSLNVTLLSLLYQCTPQQLRLILIDPKMLELSVYEGIPHLLTPVVTDMRDAATALRWCVGEMERRYRLMAALGVRNIAGYNLKIKEARERGEPLLDPFCSPDTPDMTKDELQELPLIVVLADEFADMMAVVGKKVETLIARLAQKARAAGIHLILATQRPSVDVITGLIKANIPTRIAFQVSSKIDSRTILDQQGAEQLLGHGDMLYLPPGTGVPVRVHGAYVADDEVHSVVGFLKKSGKPDYIEEILEDSSGEAGGGGSDGAFDDEDGEQDALYDQAVEFVAKSRKVSISSIQRRFKIGYNRAARIVETMETAGVVSKMENNGTREVLVPERVE